MTINLAKFIKKNWLGFFLPLIFTRVLLLWVGWFAQYLTPSQTYPITKSFERGFTYTPWRFIDIWARWDTGWYLDIIKNGYQLSSNANGQGNLAFFPLYPLIIKFLVWPIFSFINEDWLIILVGLIFSNLCLLGALWLLQVIAKNLFDAKLADLTIWMLLTYPASFIFSCFYTESLFLFLSLATYYLMTKKQYLSAGVMGMLAALTRSQGLFLIVLPLWEAWVLWRQKNVDFKKSIKLWMTISFICLGTFSFLFYSQLKFNNWQLPIISQSAWGKSTSFPTQTIFSPLLFIGYITPIDKWVAIICFVTSIYLFRILSNKGLAIYSFVSVILPLTTGVLHSYSRYVAVIFPLYLGWAYLITKFKVRTELVLLSLFTIQASLFIAWCQFYWVL